MYRGIGTVKRKLYKSMALRGSKRWVGDLRRIIEEINNTKIARMGFRPNDVTPRNEAAIYQKFYSTPRPVGAAPKFRVGGKVRRSEPLIQFRRSFYPGWSPHIFTISAINRKLPHSYKLRDYYGVAIPGSYYAEELQTAKHPNYFLIEEVLERRGNRVRVKWWGYNSIQWINARDLYNRNPRNN